MAEANLGEITASTLNRVAIIVGDARKVAEDYWNLLGIGPWDVYTLEPPVLSNTSYLGKPSSYGFNVAVCCCGLCELELIEPIYGVSMYQDFLSNHGEGLQHLQCLTNSVNEATKRIQAFDDMGFSVVMDGYLGDGYFAFIDTTSALKCVWEVVKIPNPIAVPRVYVPADENEISHAKIVVKSITQVAFVVKNLEEAMENYYSILGVGPWSIRKAAPPELHGQTYYGRPSNFTARVGYTMSRAIQIELVQPVSGESIHRDHLLEHGEGLHHLQFRVDDIEQTTEIMNKKGFSTLTSGRYYDGGFAYYNTVEKLKCIWEAFQPPTKTSPMGHYP